MNNGYKSALADEILSFLRLREVSHSKSSNAHDKGVFKDFDDFLYRRSCLAKALDETTILDWIASLNGKSSTIANKVIVVRLFTEYLATCGIHAHIPCVPKVRDDYIPYIFSDAEMSAIFLTADRAKRYTRDRKTTNSQVLMPIILRIMYGCGTRIGETLALTMGDVDLENGTLSLKKTKRSKERMVPMHPNLTKVLADYCMALKIISCPDRYLFENQENGKPISERRAQYLFDRLLNETEIELPGRQKHERGPCLHCLRHRFAIDSFIQAEQNRQCLDDAVPYLSIYLGHDSLEETQKYLKFSAELYPGVLDNFASFAADIFPEVTYENQDI